MTTTQTWFDRKNPCGIYPASFSRRDYEAVREVSYAFLPTFHIALRNGVIVKVEHGSYRFRLARD
jgi:hypothetical protein